MINRGVQYDTHGFLVDPPPALYNKLLLHYVVLCIKFRCRQRRMHTDMCKPTDDHNVTDHVRKKRDLLQNCGGLRWNLPGIDVRGEFQVTTGVYVLRNTIATCYV